MGDYVMRRNKMLYYLGTAALALALGALVASSSAWAGDDTEKLKTDLEGGGVIASGNAKWEKRDSGTCNPTTALRCKFSVEGEDFAPGVAVMITTTCVGFEPADLMAVTDDEGFFDLNLDTDLGDTVGDCVAGNSVTAQGGRARITGTLQPD
jgi:hypothetical protein